jgi:hypothetical protein
MGQRHQIFVKIANPVKYASFKNATEKKEREAEFGTGEFTVLAYHNQWLYGRSALQNALHLLQFGKQFTKEEKTDIKSWGAYDCPFGVNGMKQKFSIDETINSIAFIMNFNPVKTAWLDAGIGSSFYIGKEDEGIREDFTRGDNNDGITIIDLVENKYCFMNIYEQDLVDCYDVKHLPKFKPASAKEYVAAYYGETIESTNPYYFGDHDRTKITKTVEQQQKIVNAAIKVNKQAAKGFDKFEVLTLNEVQAMFTKMKLIAKKGTKIKLFDK